MRHLTYRYRYDTNSKRHLHIDIGMRPIAIIHLPIEIGMRQIAIRHLPIEISRYEPK